MNFDGLELIELNELNKLNKNQIEQVIKSGHKENLLFDYNRYKLENKILFDETFLSFRSSWCTLCAHGRRMEF